MNSLSHVELHHRFSPHIDKEIEAALARLPQPSRATRTAVTELLRHRQLRHPLSVLPLLVHAVETGDPEPAVPLAAVHVLWWTSACYFDDLADAATDADGQSSATTGTLGRDEALLASVICGQVLPVHAVRSPKIPESLRNDLADELMNCSALATEGQLGDIHAAAHHATPDSVIAIYRGKSSVPFGMITAMAAKLSGAKSERVEVWREFGYVLGILWQIFNDQEDILSGRHEDLANGTVTYLLACALDDGPPHSREHLLALHADARVSARARSELLGLLLAPAVLHRYRQDIDALRDTAYRLLEVGRHGGSPGGSTHYLPVLRQLVDRTAQLLLPPPRPSESGSADAA
jgi:heptaprenyl diphosphate synthase